MYGVPIPSEWNFMSNREKSIFHLRVLHPGFVSIAYCLEPLER